MTYNELYLLILGSIALISAGIILFTISNASKDKLRDNKRKRC